MKTWYLFLIACCSCLLANAQQKDSFFVMHGRNGWLLEHVTTQEENVFSVARKYHTPPAMISDENKIKINQTLKPGRRLYIPLGAYNMQNDGGIHTDQMRPIYYQLQAGESLKKIARNSLVSTRKLMNWNNLTENDLYAGRVIQVGWLLYDALVKNISPPSKKDTAVKPPPNKPSVIKKGDTTYYIYKVDTADSTDSLMAEKLEAEIMFDVQTMEGTHIVNEKGPAVFFPSSRNENANFYYAFHNTATRGRIIEVKNVNNGRIVFVKVLGRIPDNGMYHNCIIGISSRAKEVLGVRDEKAWCELRYAP